MGQGKKNARMAPLWDFPSSSRRNTNMNVPKNLHVIQSLSCFVT